MHARAYIEHFFIIKTSIDRTQNLSWYIVKKYWEKKDAFTNNGYSCWIIFKIKSKNMTNNNIRMIIKYI